MQGLVIPRRMYFPVNYPQIPKNQTLSCLVCLQATLYDRTKTAFFTSEMHVSKYSSPHMGSLYPRENFYPDFSAFIPCV